MLSRWDEFETFWNNKVFPSCNEPVLHAALLDFMARVSDEVMEVINSKIWIVYLSSKFRALNVPIHEIIRPHKEALRFEKDVLVFSDHFGRLSPKAGIGLIAHEVAHSFVEKSDHFENEAAADDLVKSLGFAEELQALREEPDELGLRKSTD